MDAIPTVDDIIERCLRLNAKQASKVGGERILDLCTTRIYDAVRINGEVVPLKRVDNRYAACYVRVSTEKQREDGFSQEEQLRRIISHFTNPKQRWSFRVFNDCGLSGGVPFRDPDMMRRVWKKKAKVYRSVYRAVFLNNAPYLPEEIAQMEAWLENAYQRILEGGVLEGLEKEVSGTKEDGTPKYRGRERTRVQFRPALSIMLENLPLIHTICVTDSSRLSRSEAVTWEIAQMLDEEDVRLEGLLETVDWNESEDLGQTLSTRILSVVSEYKLRESTLGSFRGVLGMLEKGLPFSLIPFWLAKNKETGKAVLKRDKDGGEAAEVQLARTIIRTYMREDEQGEGSCASVATMLNGARIKSPRGKAWSATAVRAFLTQPALIGEQRCFGRNWPGIFEPLIEREEWETIQEKISRRAKQFPRPQHRSPEGYLMSGMLECACGASMIYQLKENGTEQYRCRKKPSERAADPDQQHSTLNKGDVDAFFNTVMEDYHAEIVRAFKDGSQGEMLKHDIAHLEDRLIAVRNERREKAETCRAEALQRVRVAFGEVNETDTQVRRMLDDAVALLQRHLIEEEEEIQEHLRLKKQEQRAVLRGDHLAQVEARLTTWGEMNTLERNSVLKRVFYPLKVVGDPPQERIIVRLRTAQAAELPSIPVEAKKWSNWRRQIGITPARWIREFGRIQDEEGLDGYRVPRLPAEEMRLLFPKEAQEIEEDAEAEAYQEEYFAAHPEAEVAHYQALAEKMNDPSIPSVRPRRLLRQL